MILLVGSIENVRLRRSLPKCWPTCHCHSPPSPSRRANCFACSMLTSRRKRSIASDPQMRGIFRSVDDLKAAINRFVAQNNADPKPFIWTADPGRVLAAVKHGKLVLKSVH